MQALPNLNTSRWVMITSEKSKYVVLAIVPCLRDKTEVWGIRPTICKSGCLLIWIRLRETITQLARTCKHLTLIIRTINHFNFSSHCLGFLFSIGHPHQITV